MNQYCFNKLELSAFLEREFNLTENSEVPHIDAIIEQWTNWETQLTCLATLLSQVLETKQKQDIDVHNILENLYQFSEIKGLFDIEQVNIRFLDFMFEHIREVDLEIEDNLIKIKQELNERKY